MEGQERRERLLEILKERKAPIPGNELSKLLKVSRQVIVQDVALLRAGNLDILSTTRGYVIYNQEKQKARRCFPVKHTTEQIEDELCVIVDNGGRVLDVMVSHGIYGEITTNLAIASRQDVYDFVDKMKQNHTVPLKDLSGGSHLHTVEADSEEILDKIEKLLEEKNYLIKKVE